MTSLIGSVDAWFLKLAVVLLGGYFLWSLRKILADFKEEVKGLKTLIGKVFDKTDNFEHRLSSIEGRCEAMHGNGGRRKYDPLHRLSMREDFEE